MLNCTGSSYLDHVALLDANCRYNDRLYGLLRNFGERFADIEAIYRQTIAAERLRVQPQWWKQVWARFWSRFTTEPARILAFISSLDDNQVLDVTTQALGDTLAVHRRFKEHYQLNGAAAAAVQRNRIKERRQPNSAAPAADPQSETFMPHAVDSPQNNLATPTTAAVTADLNVQMGQSLPRARPFDDVHKARAAEVNRTMIDFKSRSCLRAEQFELEEIVVQAAIPPVMTELGMLDSNAADAVSAASLMRRAK
jgi:hypothetical protein